jgi:zinc protease
LAPLRAVLDNGVVFLGKETRSSPAVSLHLGVRAGSICDPRDAAGASWLLSRVIDRGTNRRSAAEVAETLDNRGITLSISVTRHLLSIVCTCLTEDFETVLALIAEMLMTPSIAEDELALRRHEVVTSIRQDQDNPAVLATETLMELLYPDGHPYGRRTKGTVDIVEGLSRRRLVALHEKRFAPTELSAVVVGDIDPERAHDLTARAFGEWRRPAPTPVALSSPAPSNARRRRVIPMMNKSQADIAYGFTSITRADSRYESFRVMNNVLGQYSLGGRLGDSIRERQGMAYYVSSALDANVVEGPLVIRAGVSPANVNRAVDSIDAELSRFAQEGVTPRELDESRRYLIGSMPRMLETNAAIAAFLHIVEFFGLGLDYDVRVPDLLRAVTVDAVNEAARDVLDPSRATVVVAGPYEE